MTLDAISNFEDGLAHTKGREGGCPAAPIAAVSAARRSVWPTALNDGAWNMADLIIVTRSDLFLG